jgi:hypothetical protein
MAQGIDSAESNLPQQYAGGGIIAFQAGGDTPKSALSEDIGSLWNSIKEGYSDLNRSLTRPQWLEGIRGYLTRPNQKTYSPGDADIQPGGYYGNDSNVPPAIDNKNIVIHPTAPKAAGPGTSGAPSAPSVPTPTYKPADTSGIDSLVKGYEDMIRGGDNFKQAEEKADTNAMRKLFLGMMAGKSPYFFTNAGEAGIAAQEGLEKSQEAIQARKDKQITQLMGLGLKGEDLKNAARKMGIDEAELQAKLPYYQAHANYYNAAAKAAGLKGSGAGSISAGSIGAKDYWALKDKYNTLAANPKADPTFYATLPKLVQDALKASPGTPSYQRGLDEVKKITDRMMAQDINEARALGAKKVPLSSIED